MTRLFAQNIGIGRKRVFIWVGWRRTPEQRNKLMRRQPLPRFGTAAAVGGSIPKAACAHAHSPDFKNSCGGMKTEFCMIYGRQLSKGEPEPECDVNTANSQFHSALVGLPTRVLRVWVKRGAVRTTEVVSLLLLPCIGLPCGTQPGCGEDPSPTQ